MSSAKITFQNQPIRLVPDIDVIGITVNRFSKSLYYAFRDFLDWNSIDRREYHSNNEWQQVKYYTVIQNRIYRITLIESQYRNIYLVKLYKPALDVCKEAENIFPNGTYTVSYLEYDFNYHCPDVTCASILNLFLKESYHLSYLKKASLSLKRFPRISYRSNPRKTKTKANRMYIDRNDSSVPKLEYIAKRRWIRDNGIDSIQDCFLVYPMTIIKNSSFRLFDYDAIGKRLKRNGMRSNIAARYVNRGKEILTNDGFHAAYRHFAKQIDNLSKPIYTPFHPFHFTFTSAVEKMTFVK